jgi:hypothetical protein
LRYLGSDIRWPAAYKMIFFFTFELHKKIWSKKCLICFKLRWSKVLGNFGEPRGGKLYSSFTQGMKKAYSPFPHSRGIEIVIPHFPHFSMKYHEELGTHIWMTQRPRRAESERCEDLSSEPHTPLL